ncbi:hypothetical protein ACI78R_11575 [Geodermatophilus sp. SYSU D01106]
MSRARRVLVALLTAACCAAVLAGVLTTSSAPRLQEAADPSQFRPGNIISDQLFFDGNAMSAPAVQTFLNQKNPNCVVGSAGLPCLKDYRQDTWTRPADANCPGTYVGAPGETAATIIAKVGQACGISQRVLLVLLQKEQSLVTGTRLTASQYQKATGYACPDTAPCNEQYFGFFNQVYMSAWRYKWYAARPGYLGRAVGATVNIQWSPNASCGSARVLLENQATVGLYNYTPYQPNAASLAAYPNQGDGCSSYGNRNFWFQFTNWFGSTQVPGASEVTARYAETGGPSGRLGATRGDVVCGLRNGGCMQNYTNGAIYWSPATGARVVWFGAVNDKWASYRWEGGPVGYPVGDGLCGLAGGGCFQAFEGGSLYWSPATGAHFITAVIRDKWGALGYEFGSLGYPINDQTTTPNGAAQYVHFQRGSIYWSAATGAHVLSGAVYDRWAASGWENSPIGLPVSDVATTPDGVGTFAHFRSGSIYSTSATGARVIRGEVYARWAASGWENGPLGYPISDQATTPDGAAQYVHLQRGSIYWSAGTGAHVLSGEVYDAWAAAGWERSALGLPTSDVATTPDRRASYAHFKDGSVYVTSSGTWTLPSTVVAVWSRARWEHGDLGFPTGAAQTTDGVTTQPFEGGRVVADGTEGGAVLTALLPAYEAAGGPAGALGVPTSATGTTPDGRARYQHFRGGSLYATGTGTHVLPAAVITAWGRSGWERGPLGYPVAAAQLTGDVTAQRFEGGVVYATASGSGAVTTPMVAAYDAAGGPAGTLGLPTSATGRTPDGKATYQHFQGGSVYVTATGPKVLPTAVVAVWARSGWEGGSLGYPTGAAQTAGGVTSQAFERGTVYVSGGRGFAVQAALAGAYQAAGGPAGTLGVPVSDTGRTPDGKATYQHFEGGSIYSTATGGARVLPTAFRDAWALSGFERGPLGYPVADVRTTPDGLGEYQHFEAGSVYRTRATGAHFLYGTVLEAWARGGWETGVLRFPTTDVTVTPDGQGRYAYFQGGAVYSSPAGGTRVVRGAVLDAWGATGWEQGRLGYPTGDAQAVAGGTRQTFQNGTITVNGATGEATVQPR